MTFQILGTDHLRAAPPLLHKPGCEFLDPSGLACTCGSFDQYGRHRCRYRTSGNGSCEHRYVFGDLLPIDDYRNGNTGVHHTPTTTQEH